MRRVFHGYPEGLATRGGKSIYGRNQEAKLGVRNAPLRHLEDVPPFRFPAQGEELAKYHRESGGEKANVDIYSGTAGL